MESGRTVRFKFWKNFFGFLSNWLPIICLFLVSFYGFYIAPTIQKACMAASLSVICILLIFNVLFKKRLTCIPYLLLICIAIAVEKIGPVLIVFASYCVMDDFIFSPLHAKFKRLWEINKEIDVRNVREN